MWRPQFIGVQFGGGKEASSLTITSSNYAMPSSVQNMNVESTF
jgi:hypothetical protein